MSDPHLSREDSLQTYIEKKRNQSNIIDIIDILDKSFCLEPRTNHSEYYSKTVHVEWSRFCKTHPKMSKAELTEKALIYAMMVIPNKNALIQIDSSNEKENNLDDQIEEVILIDELHEAVRTLSPERKLHLVKKKKLAKLLKRCQKLNQRGERLEELMKEAVSYLV